MDSIKKAYRELAQKYHPDNHHDHQWADLATEKMKEINEAYDQIQRIHRGFGGSKNYSNTSSGGSEANTYYDPDSMEGHEFEYFCADLLIKNGYSNVEVTQGSGDHGVDILATKDGVSYAIQCKRQDSKVGNKAVQEIFTGKTIYKKDVGVVLTNNFFTPAAYKAASKTGVRLWDREDLDAMIKTSNKATTNVTLSKKGCIVGATIFAIIALVVVAVWLINSAIAQRQFEAWLQTGAGMLYESFDYSEEQANQIMDSITSLGISNVSNIEQISLDEPNWFMGLFVPRRSSYIFSAIPLDLYVEIADGEVYAVSVAEVDDSLLYHDGQILFSINEFFALREELEEWLRSGAGILYEIFDYSEEQANQIMDLLTSLGVTSVGNIEQVSLEEPNWFMGLFRSHRSSYIFSAAPLDLYVEITDHEVYAVSVSGVDDSLLYHDGQVLYSINDFIVATP